MHTHTLADDLRPRRSLWLSKHARWTAAAGVVLLLAVVVFAVVYRLNQRPYGFDPLSRIGVVALPAGTDHARAFLDGGRAFLGRPVGGDGYELRSVDADDPAGPAIWTNTSFTRVDTFSAARGSVLVTGRPDDTGARHLTLLNANNGIPFATFDMAGGDRWSLIGKYLVRYAAAEHRLTVTDVGTGKPTATLDQATGAYWPTVNWSGQQVATSTGGDALVEALTVDPHIVRATPDRGLEVLGLAGGHALSSGTAIADPADLVYAYEDQIYVAPRTAAFELRAYDRARLSAKPLWTWTSPDPSATPLFVTACGEQRICVGEEHHLTVLDTDEGTVAFRVAADRPSNALPVGDRLMVRTATPTDGVTETLLDATGHTVSAWPGTRAARLDEGSYLLLPATLPAGPFSWRGVDAEHGRAHDLGSLDARPDDCTWSHRYLACVTPTGFAFYRVRAPWYSM